MALASLSAKRGLSHVVLLHRQVYKHRSPQLILLYQFIKTLFLSKKNIHIRLMFCSPPLIPTLYTSFLTTTVLKRILRSTCSVLRYSYLTSCKPLLRTPLFLKNKITTCLPHALSSAAYHTYLVHHVFRASLFLTKKMLSKTRML
jgi:hypothetical protein